jgi:hypothetical protein
MSAICQALKRPRRWLIFVLALVALLAQPLAAPPDAAAQAGSITGIVIDPDGLAPPADTVVRLLNPDHTTFGQANVDPGDGTFSFGAVPNGNYILRAIPPGSSRLTPSEPVPVSVLGAPVDVGRVPLTHPTILGTVYAPDGLTPTAAWVQVHTARRWVQTTPAPGGDLRIGGLPPGHYVLQAWPMHDEPYWASERLEVAVGPDASQTISLTLTSANVYGTAVDPLGQPVEQAIARVMDGDGEVVGRDLTSSAGYLAIGGLTPGSYRLVLEPPWWDGGLLPPEPVPFSVPPQQDLGTIYFQASNKIVNGVVETNTSQPVVGALIDAHRLDKAGRAQAISGAGGAYSIHLSAGLWTLTVEPVSGTTPANWLYLFGPQLVHFQHDSSEETKTVDFQVITADSNVVGTIQMPDGGVPPFTVTVGIHTDAGIGRSQAIDPDNGSFDIPVPHGAYKVTIRADDREHMGPPVDPIQVLPNSTTDLGPLTLLERNATISGIVTGGGDPVGDVPLIAWRLNAHGWAETRTGPDGRYVLPVVEGTWLVKPAPEPEQPWLYTGKPEEVEVPDSGTATGVNFRLVAADAQIVGTLVDEQGTPVADVEGWAQAVNMDDPAIQNGAPVEDGTFAVLVPAGRYGVSLKLPAGVPWLAPPAQQATAGSGEMSEIVFVLRAKDAAIAGALWDPRAEQVVTGAQASVMAFSEGSWVRTAVFPGNGTYRVGVAAGIWALGYRVDPASGYVALRHRQNYPVASGQTVPAPLPVAGRDGLIAGIVRDPSGTPLPSANIVADGLGGALGDLSLRTTSDDEGRFHLRLPHGHYLVRATIAADTNWIHPASLNVAVPEGGSVTDLELQFREPDATIRGVVTLEGFDAGEVAPAGTVKLWAYSSDDGYTKNEAELGGNYTLDVISRTVWFVGAAYQEGTSYWAAAARVEVPEGGATLDLELHGPHPLPAPVTVSFDASQEQYVELADGTSIYIPAGAMPVSGTMTLHVTPIATFPHQRQANVYRYGYAFTAADRNGQPIEQQFNQDVLITFPYDEAELMRMGILEQGLKPAYFSTTTDSWTFPESYVVDTVADMVAMEIDHFTDFALTGAAHYRVFLPLVLR